MSEESQRISEQAMFQEHLAQQPHAPVGVFDLPCGYLAPDGTLITEVKVREMTGAEEDMLGAKNMSGGKKMTQLIAGCLERLGPVVDKPLLLKLAQDLTIGDRVYLIFAIRRVTLGDTFPFEHKCPNCDRKSNYYIDLSLLDVKRMKDPKKRIYEFKSPSGRTTAQWHVMTGKDEETLSALGPLDALSASIFVRLNVLNGAPPTLEAVKALSLPERNALREEFEEQEGGVETGTELGCPACGHTFEAEMNPASTGFFFPSRVQKNSRRNTSSS